MSTLEFILALIAGLSGVGNLAQWTNLRAMRQKSAYEADNSCIENIQKVSETQAKEIERLNVENSALRAKIDSLTKANIDMERRLVILEARLGTYTQHDDKE